MMLRDNRHITQYFKLAILLLALLPLQSCNRRDKHSLKENDKVITMGVRQAGTKAVIESSSADTRIYQMIRDCFAQGQTDWTIKGGFAVHGYKTVNTEPTKLFDNMRVYPDLVIQNLSGKPDIEDVETAVLSLADDLKWVYTPLRYWDSNPLANYQFIAYWPYILGEADVAAGDRATTTYASSPGKQDILDGANKELVLHNIPNWQTVNEDAMDFMTATSVGRYADEYSSGMVSLSFRHLLSQLVIKAYYVGREERTVEVNGQITGGVRINSITMSAYTPVSGDPAPAGGAATYQVLGNSKATFTQRYDSDPVAAVTLADSYVMQDVSNNPIIFKNEMSEDPNYINNFAPVEVARWLMVPHTWYKQNMTIEFSVGSTVKTSSAIPVSLGTEAPGYATQPGKTYVLTLIFDTTGGGFTVESVAVKDWNEYEIEKEVYNW